MFYSLLIIIYKGRKLNLYKKYKIYNIDLLIESIMIGNYLVMFGGGFLKFFKILLNFEGLVVF